MTMSTKAFLSMFTLAIEVTSSFGNGLPDQAPPVGTIQNATQATVAVNDTDESSAAGTIPQPMPKQYATRQVTTYQKQCQGGFCTLVPVTSLETYEVTNATSDPVGSKQKAAVVVASPAQAPSVAAVVLSTVLSTDESATVGRGYLFPRLHTIGEEFAARPKLFQGKFLKRLRHGKQGTGSCTCAGCGN